ADMRPYTWQPPSRNHRHLRRAQSPRELSLAAATSITVSLFAAQPAEARCWGCAVGVGVAAGVVTGAIVGSAIANYYGPAYAVQLGYVAYAGYGAGPPVGCPGGYWARRPVAFDAYGNPIGWSRPRYFCP